MSHHYRGPTIDHSLLSPSGRMSKRARTAAMDRETKRLFPAGYWDTEPKVKTPAERAAILRRTAANLRDLAARGMKPRAYTKAAEKLEAEAARLEGEKE